MFKQYCFSTSCYYIDIFGHTSHDKDKLEIKVDDLIAGLLCFIIIKKYQNRKSYFLLVSI